jgi:DNA-binding HxlR family transcriptional regulator
LSPGSLHVPESCKASAKSVGEILGRIGNKWSLLVVISLRDGSRRFSEIRQSIPEVSQRMLTLTLRALERDGLVSRNVTPTIPPRVDYELTALGHSLRIPVVTLGKWVMENLPQIQSARAAFDAHDRTR